MSPEVPSPAHVPCRDAQGRVIATVLIWNARKEKEVTGEAADLIRWSETEAEIRSEEPVQLRERGRYVYQINSDDPVLILQERPGVSRSPASSRDGLIEPGDQCGVLPLTILRGIDSTPVAAGAVEFRSIKLHYREHYRGMLGPIAGKCAGLLLDSRANTRLRLSSAWRNNRALLEQQLEFLRHTLESTTFCGAVDEVLRNPHRRLEDELTDQPISRPFKAGKDFARQLSRAGDRAALPANHPLRTIHPLLKSLPARIDVARRTDILDTAENRFVKMVLVEFRDFLAEVSGLLTHEAVDAAKLGNIRLLRDVSRLRGRLDAFLGRGWLLDVSRPEVLPLGSPVLQRKAGYRELLHTWLQFHVGAQLDWDGGREVWQGGARNVATLYEYWLFFQLEALFRSKFSCTAPLHAVLLEKDAGLPRLKLQRGVELRTPIGGAWSQAARRPLNAEFHFNHKFTRNPDHQKAGSWTRGVQPDYTISVWPAEFTKEQAEACEALVHVHFDAKYRVERAKDLFGANDDDEPINDRTDAATQPTTAAKYADLLKMHAYRDAIRRTAGAYVLYPGNAGDGRSFTQFELTGFHEILPGLGAFSIRPRADGTAEGMDDLRQFLDKVIEHLSNRTTARERASYHAAESYSLEESPVAYGQLVLAEKDEELSQTKRALPPAEHHVVVAWYNSPEQLDWTKKSGFANVRLGNRPGTWHVPPEFASARHILLRSHDQEVADGLWRLKKPGYKVFTDSDLKKTDYPGSTGGEIYAVFEVEHDSAYAAVKWDGAKLLHSLEEFEARRTYRQNVTLRRRSPDPRVLSLRELLKAQAT